MKTLKWDLFFFFLEILGLTIVFLCCFFATSTRVNISEVLVHGTLTLRIWKHKPPWYALLLFMSKSFMFRKLLSLRYGCKWVGSGAKHGASGSGFVFYRLYLYLDRDGSCVLGSGSGINWKNKDSVLDLGLDPKQDVVLFCIPVWKGLKIVLLII